MLTSMTDKRMCSSMKSGNLDYTKSQSNRVYVKEAKICYIS